MLRIVAYILIARNKKYIQLCREKYKDVPQSIPSLFEAVNTSVIKYSGIELNIDVKKTFK